MAERGPPGAIISRDADDRDVCFIVSGRARDDVLAHGEAGHLSHQVAGEFLDEFSAIDAEPRALDVVGLASTLVGSLTPTAFPELLREHPLLVDRVLGRLTALLRDISERVTELRTLGLANSIQAELLRLAVRAGIEGNIARVDPTAKHAGIASHVSTNREQVTRDLPALAGIGLLSKDGAVLVVRDVGRLEHVAREMRSIA